MFYRWHVPKHCSSNILCLWVFKFFKSLLRNSTCHFCVLRRGQTVWRNDQTCWSSISRFASQTMFDRMDTSQNIAWQAKTWVTMLLKSSNIFNLTEVKIFDVQCFVMRPNDRAFCCTSELVVLKEGNIHLQANAQAFSVISNSFCDLGQILNQLPSEVPKDGLTVPMHSKTKTLL